MRISDNQQKKLNWRHNFLFQHETREMGVVGI
jgi:hypothetical protein